MAYFYFSHKKYMYFLKLDYFMNEYFDYDLYQVILTQMFYFFIFHLEYLFFYFISLSLIFVF